MTLNEAVDGIASMLLEGEEFDGELVCQMSSHDVLATAIATTLNAVAKGGVEVMRYVVKNTWGEVVAKFKEKSWADSFAEDYGFQVYEVSQ